MSIGDNLVKINQLIPRYIKLVAVSKTKPVDDILEAYNTGQRIFGENKVQELEQKYNELPKDIEWHMIGHLQSNKVKYIAPFIKLIHAVDSLKLLEVINKEAVKNNRIINYMFQMYIATEESKFGLELTEIEEIIQSSEFKKLSNVRLLGLMGMATFTDNENTIRSEFREIKKAFDYLRNSYFSDNNEFCELSIGMSSDFQIAIEEGSTMVRVGSSIFGNR